MNLPRLLGALTALALVSAGAPSSGQTLAAPAQRPGQGLFDRSHRGTQSLDVSVSVSDAYDDDALADGETGGGPRQSGSFGSAATSVAYSKKLRYAQIVASEGSAVRYYPSLTDLVAVQHDAKAGIAFQAGGISLNVSQALAYRPLFAFAAVPQLFESGVGDLPPITSDQTTVRHDQRSYSTNVDFSEALGRRTTLSLSGAFQKTAFQADAIDQTALSLAGHLSRNLTRDLSLVGGFKYQQGTYASVVAGAGQAAGIHSIDIGVDYSRALGRTRRTTIGFTSGTSGVEQAGQPTGYTMTGNARLNRDIGRTGHATMAFTRGVGFVDGFPQPLVSDSIATSLGGSINRRLEVTLSSGLSRGQFGLAAGAAQNDTYRGSARLRLGISRTVALSGEYFYYHYRFSDGAVLPAGVPSALDRQGFRLGLDFWLPVIR